VTSRLDGRTIAFMVANAGVEQVELTQPWEALQSAGARTVLIAPERGQVQAFDHDVEKAGTFPADQPIADVRVDDVDGLVLPGGTTNPDKLRLDPDAVHLVRSFVQTRKPIAAICHGPWTLVEADVVAGKTLTSWPSLRTDIENAGGVWQDAEVVTSREEGWTLVTSRKPADLEAFIDAAIEAFRAGVPQDG
jgi:protease I